MHKSKICSDVFPTSNTRRLGFSVCQESGGMIVPYLCAQLAVLYSVQILIYVWPESPYNKQICSTLSVYLMAYTIGKGLAYIITLYTITSLLRIHLRHFIEDTVYL